ncbi:MAG: PilZ domain-containing protein [Candidatus Sulfotelmatobacter sp.]
MDCEVSIRDDSQGAVTKRSLEDRLWLGCIRNIGFDQRGVFFSPRVTQMTASHANTRRWKRYPEELRVRVLPCSRLPAIAVTGRGAGLSQGGMALHAGVDMELDDLVEIEFPTPHPVKVMAAVRNHNGRYFGLEFLARLHGQTGGLPRNRPPALPKPHAKIADNVKITDPALVKRILAALDRKLLEITRVRREIEALIIAVPLLGE